MMEKVLECKNVYKKFKNKNVLNGITFDVMETEIFGIIGLNGIGKTTLIKCILNLSFQDSGEIKLFGVDSFEKEARKAICFLPEKFYPNLLLTGKEFCEIFLAMHLQKYNQSVADAVASELDFDPSLFCLPMKNYSKGTAQKIGLIAAFMTDARLFVLDEPMTGLDPRARIFLKRKIANIQKQGKTIIFSSHILADIQEISNKIAVLDKGIIKYLGASDDLIKKYKAKSLEDAFLSIN